MNYKGAELVKTPLGAAGGKFIAEMLEGETGLAGAISKKDFTKGQSFAFLPATMHPELTVQFERGFLIANSMDHLAAHYSDRASKSAESAMILLDQWMLPGDYGQRPLGRFEVHAPGELYHCLSGADITVQNMRDCDNLIHTFNWVGVFVEADLPIVARFRQTPFDVGLIDLVIDHTREVFMSAYDGESFVVWTL